MPILSIVILVIAAVLLVLVLVGVPVSQRALNILFLALVVLLTLNYAGVV